MKNPRHILITGASSGLGAALAKHYAAAGVTLQLHGRNAQRLQAIAAECTKRGATVHIHCGDVADFTDMERWILAADAAQPLDLIIANAGISGGTGGGGESAAQAREIFRTNIDGVVATIQPLIPRMIARKHGQIALVGSLAGIRGLPSSPAYSASKSFVNSYGEGLRGWLAKSGVSVCTMCPGFIKTPMTDVNGYDMPLLMSPEAACRIIARGLGANKPRIAFPLRLYVPLLLLGLLPRRLTDLVFSRLPGKPPLPNAPQG